MSTVEQARWVPKGLQLQQGMTFDAWLSVGRRVLGISKASPWCIGDWLIYGHQRYGERYKAALETTAFDYQTLRNYAWVARRFDMSRRRDTVSFQHHAEVAALREPEQELWLERAERMSWSRNELRRQIGAARRRGVPRVSDTTVTVRLCVALDREQHWSRAAAGVHQALGDWIAAAADVAAEAQPAATV